MADAYTLNGVPFDVETGGDIRVSSPPPPPQLRSERPIPYSGGLVTVDRGGRGLPHWNFTMFVTPARRAAMLANLDVAPIALVTPDGTWSNCELVALSDASATPTTGTRNGWLYSAEIAVA